METLFVADLARPALVGGVLFFVLLFLTELPEWISGAIGIVAFLIAFVILNGHASAILSYFAV